MQVTLETEDADKYRRVLISMALGILALGTFWRTVRYLLPFPIWGDEALLTMNFAWFDCAELVVRLENCQIAPLLFLWGERGAYWWLGAGELSLRLLPFLAGVGSLALYWRLTGLLLAPRARLFAVGFLAVASWPVTMSTLIKPYSFDLLMSLVLLVPAVEWLVRPERTRWLIVLAVLAPVALLGSYPAAFVGGAVSLALARSVWQGSWSTRSWFVVYNAALLVGFALACHIAENHLNTATNNMSTRVGMHQYWSEAFPPNTPVAALQWFVSQSTGQMMAYPIGASNGGSVATALFCVLGAVWWARREGWTWVILFSSPIFLNLFAAILHRYPYGASGRLSQHFAPGICMLAGLGVAALVERARWTEIRRQRCTVAIAALFALIGLGGLVRDVARPYRDLSCVWTRATMWEILATVPADDPVVISTPPADTSCLFAWYWLNEGRRVAWDFQLPPAIASGQRVWGFHYGAGADVACQRFAEELRRQDPAWQIQQRISYVSPTRAGEAPERCEIFRGERSLNPVAAALNRDANNR
jgi:hypothetical protein